MLFVHIIYKAPATYVLIVNVAGIQLGTLNPILNPLHPRREAQFGDSGLRNISPEVKAGRRIFL